MFKTQISRKLPKFYCNRLKYSIRQMHKNHYDVLNVKIDCTPKDIRDSFIRLSKQHHPDSNKDGGSAQQFQRIMEAYRVLSKPDTRKDYDIDMQVRPVYARRGFANAEDAAYMHNARNYTPPNSTNYYGVDGMPKKTNSRIMWAILCFAGLGVAIQAAAIKTTFLFKQDRLDKVSIRANKLHNDIRAKIDPNADRQAQLERVLKSIGKDV